MELGVPPLRGVGSPSGLGPSASLPDRPMPHGRVGRQCALAHPTVAPNAAAQIRCIKTLLRADRTRAAKKRIIFQTVFFLLANLTTPNPIQ
jgi:hypothetical protein